MNCGSEMESDAGGMPRLGKGRLRLNIWILPGAALFSYLTVLFSAGKPCRKAAKVSPIETVKYTEERDKSGKPKKKLAVVALSISLGLVILNSVFGLVNGFSMDNYIENLIIADFSIQAAELDNPGARAVNTEAVDKALLGELKSLDGVNAVGAVYLNRGHQEFNDENWAKIDKNIFQSGLLEEKFSARGYDEDMRKDTLEYYSYKKTLDGKTYGMGELAVNKLKVLKSKDGSDRIDWDTFQSGEEFEIQSFDNAPVKEYEIYAVVEIPLAMELRHFSLFECNYVLPEDEFLALNGTDRNAMRVLLDVEDQKEEYVNDWVKNYTETVDPSMDYDSKES